MFEECKLNRALVSQAELFVRGERPIRCSDAVVLRSITLIRQRKVRGGIRPPLRFLVCHLARIHLSKGWSTTLLKLAAFIGVNSMAMVFLAPSGRQNIQFFSPTPLV